MHLAAALVALGIFLAANTSGKEVPRATVDVTPAGEVKIFAVEVSYGEVLRALQAKLSVAMDIPPLAETLKVSYASIDAATPEDALQELLDSSGLDYALVREANGKRLAKVTVFPTRRQKPAVGEAGTSAAQAADKTDSSSTSSQPADSAPIDDDHSRVPPMQIRPLSEAGEAIGLPPGKAAAEDAFNVHVTDLPPESQPVVKPNTSVAVTMPLAQAAKMIGAPPGVSPSEVGVTRVIAGPPAQPQK